MVDNLSSLCAGLDSHESHTHFRLEVSPSASTTSKPRYNDDTASFRIATRAAATVECSNKSRRPRHDGQCLGTHFTRENPQVHDGIDTTDQR